MDDKRLRRCLPLKILAHFLMFGSFAVMIAAVIYVCLYVEIYFGMDRNADENRENSYFVSNLFFDDYMSATNLLLSTIHEWNDQNIYNDLEEMEAWRSYYMDGYANFQYAIYNKEGGLIMESPNYSVTPESVSSQTDTEGARIYYYSMDISGLNLYPVEETSSSMQSGGAIVKNGSNFIHSQSFLFGNENLGDKIGYIFVYVPETLVMGDSFYMHFQICQTFENVRYIVFFGAVAAAVIFVVCLIYTILAAGWKPADDQIHLMWFDKIYTEIALAIMFCVFFLFVIAVILFVGWTMDGRSVGDIVTSGVLAIPAYMAAMFCVYSLARRGKTHNFISQSLIFKLFHGFYKVIYQGMINNNLMRKYISVILGLGIADFILMMLAFWGNSFFFFIVVTVIYCCEFIYVGRKLMAIQDIAKGASEIASGHLEYKIDTKDMGSGVFLEFANNINNIGQGLNRAVDESVKSERMKADLITNVSHDIKTPLTSIINYVDLLKRLNITHEPEREYIDILDSKSQRLKMLIEDLVEASRASSGNITLECDTIDFNELVMQVAGTYVEKYSQRQLTLVTRSHQEPILIWADGRRMYRVLDNLFNNAFKYAMTGSRVYVDLYEDEDSVCFIMKNISQEPLNITADELTQRFVRGDASRTTEGSGLGLSIAESLVQLHGGTFKIYLDGDLFKATIVMPAVHGTDNDGEAEEPSLS
ncbi:signal transduction histidine kinase [Catenibacillus scindens]|uniref:histidine kinase n=1 Tax=Catenibacillus scindens TaxID=673271 RepID=A0A7W8HC07_9FIRM|nr:HAMP domain-containing sensor histidine kinase [Catenibacillus scindens]MBB5264912.1 signal transduction histidine kinase [Catenibacillus scindens]